uniref:RING-type E3 ubiquitin transferase n=1 Tax=Opuntia streptacantha TaxID=393608 RepID=A0A7C9AXS6_OPUST
MGGNGNFLKWKFSFYHRSSPSRPQPPPPSPPQEYVCAICGSLISDPVVVGSGHTFDRLCVQVCRDLRFTPTLSDGTRPDLSTQIPNLALQSSIPNWCSQNGVAPPVVKDYAAVEKIVRHLIGNEREDEVKKDLIRPSERFLIEAVKDKPDPDVSHAVTELTHRVNGFDSSTSSEESVIVGAASPYTPLPFTTKPACWSSSSSYPNSSSSETLISDEILNHNPDCSEEEQFIAKFKSSDPFEQEQGAIALRKATRTNENARIELCTPRLLLASRSLLISRYEKVQTNAIAALVNLSLEKPNKIKIMRSGIVPNVIDLLKSRSPEAQEHAAGAIFSLSLEDDNKTAIGVLGALPPLMHCLIRSESARTRSDSALALYHLSLVHSNRVKLVKLNAVPPMLAALRSEREAVSGRVVLVLCQLAASAEGKAAMLDCNAVEHLVAMLRRRDEFESESTRENCVAALYALSHGSMRFKALAKEARAVEVLKEVEESGSERAKEKAKRILVMLKGQPQEPEEEVDWEAILESGGLSRTRHRIGGAAPAGGGVGKSTEF